METSFTKLLFALMEYLAFVLVGSGIVKKQQGCSYTCCSIDAMWKFAVSLCDWDMTNSIRECCGIDRRIQSQCYLMIQTLKYVGTLKSRSPNGSFEI